MAAFGPVPSMQKDCETIGTAPIADLDGRHDWSKPFREVEERDTVDVLMEVLTERERRILRLRYGLDGHRPLTFREVGERCHFTGARAEQLVGQAVAKMSGLATHM